MGDSKEENDRIKAIVQELKDVEKELSEVNKTAKSLRERKKDLNDDIVTYMNDNDFEVLSVGKIKFFKKTAIKKIRLKKKEKESKLIAYFKSKGIDNPTVFIRNMEESIKPLEEEIDKLII